MNRGVVVAGVVLVALAVFAGLALDLAWSQEAGEWFWLGLATGVGGCLVGTGLVS